MYVISNSFYSYPDAVLEPPMFAENISAERSIKPQGALRDGVPFPLDKA